MHDPILDRIAEACSAPRPARFVRDPDHCDECRDHEATLSRLVPETLDLAAVGNPGWDPICFATDEAFRYLLPGLCRLACGRGDRYYLGSLLSHLENRAHTLGRPQRQAVAALLDRLYEAMPAEIEARGDDHALGRVYDLLREQP